jgi:hypothetical protein
VSSVSYATAQLVLSLSYPELSHMGSALRLGLFFMNTKVRYMSLGARLRGLGSALLPFASIFVFLNMVLFPVAVLFDNGVSCFLARRMLLLTSSAVPHSSFVTL